VHKFGAALGDEVRTVSFSQTLHVGDVSQQHRALPTRIDVARARNHVLLDVLEQLRDAAMGGGFVVVRPVSRENFIGLASEQEIALLLEDAVNLFAEHLIEVGHHPAAELEALGGILPRPTRRLHDSIHGNLGADNDLSHVSFSLI
jgi:hypothetical protein